MSQCAHDFDSASRKDMYFQQNPATLSGPRRQFYDKSMEVAKRWVSRGDRPHLVMFEGKHALFRDEKGVKWKQVDFESSLSSGETHSKYVSKARWKEVSDDGRVKVHGGSVRLFQLHTNPVTDAPCSFTGCSTHPASINSTASATVVV